MNVLSLFDGISCGRLALYRAGIPVDKYYASEIDRYASSIARHNWPDNIELGDVTMWRSWGIDWSGIDLLIGGSPCTSLSVAGKGEGFAGESGLFYEYVNILNHIKQFNPDIKFLLENVKMKFAWRDVFSQELGVNPVLINSSLLSAQHRERYYWCNWPVPEPKDKGILLDTILESPGVCCIRRHGLYIPVKYKSTCIDGNYSKGVDNHGQRTVVCNSEFTSYRKFTPIECERLQTLPDNYTIVTKISNKQRYRAVGNGWTVDVLSHIFNQIKGR